MTRGSRSTTFPWRAKLELLAINLLSRKHGWRLILIAHEGLHLGFYLLFSQFDRGAL